MFSVPNILDMAMTIQILLIGTILIVFISNQITSLIGRLEILPSPLLLIIHLNIICFLYHFLKSVILWLELQKSVYNFDRNMYLDTSILVGPIIGITSAYIRPFIDNYSLSYTFFDTTKTFPQKRE
jgi:hypothetical protein